jgi:starch phosphorylase
MEPVVDQPQLPGRISRLNELAYDLWWSWHLDARDVFRKLDYQSWRATAHNPVRMLRLISPARLEQIASDPEFLTVYDAAVRGLDQAHDPQATWLASTHPDLVNRPIAYFSAEFAVHQSLPIYAGGLGALAGDHCKESSDLGLPLLGVGFMYPQGYFHQRVSAEGWQQESYERLSWADTPIQQAETPAGQPCVTAVPMGDRTVLVAVWLVQVGRVRLFLLDTDLEENAPWDRELSARLYGGDRETRLQQEIILGIGGVRALRALGIDPAVWHLNEGHAALVALQRLREFLEQGLAFDDALEEVRRTTVFTTHTPVPAGHDAFSFGLLEKHLSGAWGTLGPHRERVLALGHYDAGGGPMFNLTALALRTASGVNAVSVLHREVTDRMWHSLWAERAPSQRPLSAITNGVHLTTWLSAELGSVLDRHLREGWREMPDDPTVWDEVLAIPDEEIWDARGALRNFFYVFIRERARYRWTHENLSAGRVVASGPLLDPAALTIGFARRFTAYKRSDLIFHDPDRLARILSARGRSVQLVFAGKAHPADDVGKHRLQGIFRHALEPALGGRIAFVDDYDLHVAHFLVQGCDVWLNTPRKPLEASGTSGMKAALNGVPHLSIGDGWWAEAYNGSNGWLIDGGADPADAEAADAADAEALYRLLEEQVVPTFYERDGRGIPRGWIRVVKETIRSVAPRFCARRMVKQYVEEMYGPAARTGGRLPPLAIKD